MRRFILWSLILAAITISSVSAVANTTNLKQRITPQDCVIDAVDDGLGQNISTDPDNCNIPVTPPSPPSDGSPTTTVDKVDEPEPVPWYVWPAPGGTLDPPSVSSGGFFVDGDTITINGRAEPYAQVVVYVGGKVVGSVNVDKNGRWQFEYRATNSPVRFQFQTCFGERCSELSRVYVVLLGALTGSCDKNIELEEYRYWSVPVGSDIAIKLTDVSSLGKLRIEYGDGKSEVFTYDPMNLTEVLYAYESEGNFNGKLTYYYDNCSETRYFSVHVVRSYLPQLLALLALAVVAMAYLVWRHPRVKKRLARKKKR